MLDRNGKKLHEGELIKIVNHPDLIGSVDFWVVFDCLEVGVYVDFVLKNAITHEIKIVPQKNIQRTY